MEPGLRDREYPQPRSTRFRYRFVLQWSPVLETGNTPAPSHSLAAICMLQWSPVLETGNTLRDRHGCVGHLLAAMEPGLRDREYRVELHQIGHRPARLQWSPVLETGNTVDMLSASFRGEYAAMEPGLRDREYPLDAKPAAGY